MLYSGTIKPTRVLLMRCSNLLTLALLWLAIWNICMGPWRRVRIEEWLCSKRGWSSMRLIMMTTDRWKVSLSIVIAKMSLSLGMVLIYGVDISCCGFSSLYTKIAAYFDDLWRDILINYIRPINQIQLLIVILSLRLSKVISRSILAQWCSVLSKIKAWVGPFFR